MEIKIVDGLLGAAIGDALGVPVEFNSRESLKKNPVVDMRGYGTYNQPPGTWSDDSSLMFCLAESLCEGYNLDDMADRFAAWLFDSYWTPHGEVFDVGGTTHESILAWKSGKVTATNAGGKNNFHNGNGSLMRILPLAYYLDRNHLEPFTPSHEVSCITHGHYISQIACAFYVCFAIELLHCKDPEKAYKDSVNKTLQYYDDKAEYQKYLTKFSRIFENDIASFPEDKIASDGYVLHTLEASLWCLFKNSSYSSTVLHAVNLGGDTDTTATVAGGLAGILYGAESIPEDWCKTLACIDGIKDLAERLQKSLYEN